MTLAITAAPPRPGTYRRLLAFTKPYKQRLFWGVLLGACFGSSMSSLPLGASKVLKTFFGDAPMEQRQLLIMAAVLPLVAIASGLGKYFSDCMIQWVGVRVVMDLRNAAFARLQELSLDYYTRARSGDILSRVINDTNVIEKSVSAVMRDMVQQPFLLLGSITVVIYLNWRLAVISLLVFPICIVPVALFGRRVRKFGREGQKLLGEALSVLQEAVSGVRVVKAFGMEEYEKERFRAQSKGVFSRSVRVTRASAASEPIIVFISFIGLSLVLIYAHFTGMTIYELLGFAGAMVLMYNPVKSLSKINVQIQLSSAAADRVFELIDTAATVTDRPSAVEFQDPVGTIRFENVSFSYGETKVLEGIDLEVKPGEFVALVGRTGSGKTTLVNLLPRFYDVTSGRVLMNDRDLREYTIKSLRARIGMVTQDTFLFNDSIAANIAYGHSEETPQRIEEAARQAFAHDFILQQPQGYATVVGDRGAMLSGGQRQRISIARALLRNAPILILDEATSALDTEAERQVQAALDKLMEGRTVFAIAHRLSTIIRATRILVLDHGRIVEQGTHAELLARNGAYRKLHDMQFRDAATEASA